MDVRCERCKTEYELDDARITEAGVAVRCTSCGHVFKVKKKSLVVTVPLKPEEASTDATALGPPPLKPEPVPPSPYLAPPQPAGSRPPQEWHAPTPSVPSQPGPTPAGPPSGTTSAPPSSGSTTAAHPSGSTSAAPPSGATPAALTPLPGSEPTLPPASAGGDKAREWKVRQPNGNIFTFRELTTLQKWIVERKVARDDEISLTGENWKRLGNIAELASFFQVVEEAQRATALQHAAMTPAGGTPALTPPAQQPVSPSHAAPPLAGREPAFTRTVSAETPLEETPPRPPEKKGSSLRWVLLLLLILLAGAAAAVVYLRPDLANQVLMRLGQEPLFTTSGTPPEAPLIAVAEVDAGVPAPFDAGALSGTAPVVDAGPLAVAPEPDAGAAAAVAEADAGASSADEGVDAGAATLLAAIDAGVNGDPDAGEEPAAAKTPPRPPSFDNLLTQGYRYLERERAEQALDVFGKAAELKPGRAEPHSGRGRAYFDLGSLPAAEAAFLQALKLNPRYGEALMGLAETYRAQGRKTDALKYYERYLDVLPNGAEAPVARSNIERLKSQ